MQNIQQLAFVFVQTLDLNVKEGVRINRNAFGFNIRCQLLLLSHLNGIELFQRFPVIRKLLQAL